DRLQRSGPGNLARQPLLAFPQRYFRPPPFCDVSQDLGSTDEPAFGIPDRGDGQRDIQVPSLPRDPTRFTMFNPLAGAQPPQDLLLLVVQLRRDDDRDRLPNGFLFRISEQPLGSPVP